MYYDNIANTELQYFRNLMVSNFTIKLSDVLNSDLFKIEEIVADKFYKIYPLFYTNTITSSNSVDRILDNRCIICQKQDNKETYLTFISDENADVKNYQSFANYFDITDNLNEEQFNMIVSLLRQNIIHNDTINIMEEVIGSYGKYLFNVAGCTIIDAGIVIDNETRTAEPKVMLSNNVFHYSTYTLKLDVMHYTGVNILDDISPSNFIVVDTMELELPPDEWVTIPLTDLQDGYLISIHTNVEIKHDKPVIPDWIQSLEFKSEPNIIQKNETAEFYATGYDNCKVPVGEGHIVHFFEKLEPTINLSASPSIIQKNDNLELYAKVRDSDGSLPKNVKVHFYKEEEPTPTTITVTSNKNVLSHAHNEKAILTAKILDQGGYPMANQNVTFKIGSTVLGTVVSDSNGNASYEYSSQGLGDTIFNVTCKNAEGTVSIEDCTYNRPMTSSDSTHWTIPSSANAIFSPNGMKFQPTSSTDCYLEVPLSKPYSIELDLIYKNGYPNYLTYLWDSTKSTRHICMGGVIIDNSVKTVLDVYPNNDNYWNNEISNNSHIKLEVNEDNIKLYVNNEFKVSKTYTMPSESIFGLGLTGGFTVTWKNIKIKPL